MVSIEEIKTRMEKHAEIVPLIYGRGAYEYACDILNGREDLEKTYFDEWEDLEMALMNGAKSLMDYSNSGNTLIYTVDILERMDPVLVPAYKKGDYVGDATLIQVAGLMRAFEAIRGFAGFAA